MSITRSQIARQMYADGALVDPRMANTLEQNKAINDANTVIGNSLRQLGLTQRHFDAVDKMKRNPSAYGIENQLDYAIKSGGDLVSGANQTLKPLVALGQGLASPVYDYYQALKKYSDKGYQGEFGLSKQGITDFFKNLGLVAKEYDDQNPLLMAAGRTYGGLKETFSPTTSEGITSLNTTPTQNTLNSTTQDIPRSELYTIGDTTYSNSTTPQELMSFTGSSWEDYYTPEELKLLRTIPVSDYNTYNGGPITKSIFEQIKQARPGAGENPLNYSYAKGGRAGFANGGRGYSDYASPSSSTASQDFATQAVSGGQTNYGGDSGGYDNVPLPTTAQLNRITTPGDGTYVNPNKTVIETLRDSNFLSNFQRKGIDRALANQWAREVQRLAPYVVGDMDEDYYFGDLKTAADLGLKNAPTTLPGGKTDIPGTAEYLAFNTIGLPGLGLQSLTNLLDKALAPPATLEGALATKDKMQGIYGDIGRIGQTQFENKYMNNPPPTIDGGDNQPIRLPIIAEAPSDVESTPSDFDLYAALEGREAMRFGQNPYGYTGAMQRFAEGGRARRGYGLGGIIKSVGKAVKKVLKSDVGKAAVGLASLYYGPKLFGKEAGFTSWKNINFLKSMQDKPLPWILGASAAAGLASSKEEEEDLDQISDRKDESGLKELIAKYPALRFQVQPQYQLSANGGRIGYEGGGNINPADLPMSKEGFPTYEDIETKEEVEYPYENKEMASEPNIDAELFQMYLDAIGSGKIPRSTTFDQYKELMEETTSMGPKRTMAKEGGLMDLGGMEKDYRAEGGFVPIGKAEKADDVPARLSKNEFVFTADAVRNAGGGDVDKGAEVMYNVMKNLESGGKISEESQGLQGARNMFQTSQRLGEIL